MPFKGHEANCFGKRTSECTKNTAVKMFMTLYHTYIHISCNILNIYPVYFNLFLVWFYDVMIFMKDSRSYFIV